MFSFRAMAGSRSLAVLALLALLMAAGCKVYLSGDDDDDDTADPALCGNAVVDEGEACDDGETDECSGSCDGTCTGPVNRCGDGILRCGETCEDGEADPCGGVCDDTCTAPANRCGDGILRCGEACDDGNVSGGDGCDRRCRLEECSHHVEPRLEMFAEYLAASDGLLFSMRESAISVHDTTVPLSFPGFDTVELPARVRQVLAAGEMVHAIYREPGADRFVLQVISVLGREAMSLRGALQVPCEPLKMDLDGGSLWAACPDVVWMADVSNPDSPVLQVEAGLQEESPAVTTIAADAGNVFIGLRNAEGLWIRAESGVGSLTLESAEPFWPDLDDMDADHGFTVGTYEHLLRSANTGAGVNSPDLEDIWLPFEAGQIAIEGSLVMAAGDRGVAVYQLDRRPSDGQARASLKFSYTTNLGIRDAVLTQGGVFALEAGEGLIHLDLLYNGHRTLLATQYQQFVDGCVAGRVGVFLEKDSLSFIDLHPAVELTPVGYSRNWIYTMEKGLSRCALVGNHVVTQGYNLLHYLDMRNSLFPLEWGSFGSFIEEAEAMVVVGDTVHIAGGADGFQAARILFHADAPPTLESILTLPGWTSDVAVIGDHIYLARDVEEEDVEVFRLEGPAEPVARIPLEGSVGKLEAWESQLLAETYDYREGTGFRLEVLDVSDPASPQAIAAIPLQSGVVDMEQSGSRLHVLLRNRLRTFDLRQDGAPEEIESLDLNFNAKFLLVGGAGVTIVGETGIYTLQESPGCQYSTLAPTER